jgi:hypothetical protein
MSASDRRARVDRVEANNPLSSAFPPLVDIPEKKQKLEKDLERYNALLT